MLNRSLKNEALESLKKAQGAHEIEYNATMTKIGELHDLRLNSSKILVPQVEDYVNTLANSPKEFDKTFAIYKAEFEVFNSIVRSIEAEASSVGGKAASGAAAGVVAGVGVAAFAPSAAMAIATTFGTASTGTAISTLSGAAATKAALAWLGGGALAAGGGGMAAGNALLALAGPVGWAIGGGALVTAGLFARNKNKKIAEEANLQTKKVLAEIGSLKAARREVVHLLQVTNTHAAGLQRLLADLVNNAPRDYKLFDKSQKDSLAATLNHVQSLSALLNQKIK